jgi:Pregnancy-associated plasma protein-A
MDFRSLVKGAVCMVLVVLLFSSPTASLAEGFSTDQSGALIVGQQSFSSMAEYIQSDFFRETGKRCGARRVEVRYDEKLAKAMADCTDSLTKIQNEYWPSVVYTVPVWWHVIYDSSGIGNISDATINAQMEVLNEDYRAKAGTMGSQGYDIKIQFELMGIDRTMNDTWFGDNDEIGFKQALKKDTSLFLNIYSNNTGYLGYAYYPQDSVGDLDGIVLQYKSVGGRNNGFLVYDQGRTLVHEMGHYFGLAHTFEGGAVCGNSYSTGDLIVDTNAESSDHYGCSQTSTCGTADPIHNYMNYTDDTCMYQFTREQANRAVCGLVNYRPNTFSISGGFPWHLFVEAITAQQ